MSDTNPVIQWRLEKKITSTDDSVLVVYLSTKDIPIEQTYDKPFLFAYALREEMRAMEPYESVDIIIDSRGGDFKSAVGIYDALRRVPRYKPLRTWIKNASSAATIFLGLRGPTYISPDGQIYIHRGEQTKYENGKEVSRSRDGIMVDAAGEYLITEYQRAMRRNLSRSEYRKRKNLPKVWTAGEKTFSAEEARDAGLVQETMSKQVFERQGYSLLDVRRGLRRFKRKRLAIAATLILLAAGIGAGVGIMGYYGQRGKQVITHGKIISKQYSPAYETVKTVNILLNNGVTSTVENVKVPEKWSITVEDINGNRETWKISEEQYNKLGVGMYVNRRKEGKDD